MPGLSEKDKMDAVRFLCKENAKYYSIDQSNFEKYNVKRGLRNSDGTGVLAGLTTICNVHGYVINEGERAAVDGELTYRGIDICDLVNGCKSENRFGFEEAAWLLLFGSLPTKEQLTLFGEIIESCKELPAGLAEDMMKVPTDNIMNFLGRYVLTLYSYDPNADDTSFDNVMRQSIDIIAKLPTIMVTAYQVKRRYFDGKSMYFHPSILGMSIAEGILSQMRSNRKYTPEEAHLLDQCLMLHAEHGGGNNSTFASRVLTSSGTDTYAAISAAIGSLKGPKHGGANIKVMEMVEHMKRDIADWTDEGQVADYLRKILDKEAGDGSGLIYGTGHAVYTMSDPRALILKENARGLAFDAGFGDEFTLLENVEKMTPIVFAEKKGTKKEICANVDLYSGLVYKSLKIPPELFTPLFAVARTAGWCAHRLEELTIANRIMRPAYKSLAGNRAYVPIGQRD